jgi:hypothetical protein
MDRRIENNLEGHLQGSLDPRLRAEFNEALREAGEQTRGLVSQFEKQSRMIRSTLRTSEEVEPAPGFYARVLERIEAQKSSSVWSVLLEPLFFRRLAYATAALLLLLTVTFATTSVERQTVADVLAVPPQFEELQAVEISPQPDTGAVNVTPVATGGGGRDLVLEDLTVYSE